MDDYLEQGSFFSKYRNLLIVASLAFFVGNWVGGYRAEKSAKQEFANRILEQIEKGISAIND